MKHITVSAAIIHDSQNRIFATQRGSGDWKDWWEFPGGKIEPGETPEDALRREIQEELDTRITVGELLHIIEWDYPKFHLTMHCFLCTVESGSLTLLEHEAARWLAPHELDSVQWLPADWKVIEMLKHRNNMLLTNNIITIEVSEHGAEMTSLKKDGCEFLWTGDKRFWDRQAPILFPSVGKPYNNEIHVKDIAYPLYQHGYARDSEFEVLTSYNDLELRLKMLENEHSSAYPYKLGLEVRYQLEGSTVKAIWTVENFDDKEAYFQIGGHPGFLLPDYDPDRLVNGYVRFYNKEGELVAPTLFSDIDDGCRVPLSTKAVLLSETPLMHGTFIHDALVIEKGQVTKVELLDRHCNPILNVNCPQAEAYGVWAPHKEGCPFVCLEPWCGICDSVGFSGDVSDREYIHHLAPGDTFDFVYTIEVY